MYVYNSIVLYLSKHIFICFALVMGDSWAIIALLFLLYTFYYK